MVWLVENENFLTPDRELWLLLRATLQNEKLLHPIRHLPSSSNLRNLTCRKWKLFKIQELWAPGPPSKMRTFIPESCLSRTTFRNENFYTQELPFEGHLASHSNLRSLTCRKWKLLHPRDVDMVPSSTNEHTQSTPHRHNTMKEIIKQAFWLQVDGAWKTHFRKLCFFLARAWMDSNNSAAWAHFECICQPNFALLCML
jgi:hypothetical protein